MKSSKFITFEGGDGAGKSTQIKILADHLRAREIDCVTTREPGGTPNAEMIRKLLVTGESERWDPQSEALLHFAARRAHLKNIIWPALERGDWVISDRFADSTMAYQGLGMGLGREAIKALYKFSVGDFAPDLTFVLDIPVDLALARARQRASEEIRYENMNTQFHEEVRASFLKIAEQEPSRCVVVKAENTISAVHREIIDVIGKRFHV